MSLGRREGRLVSGRNDQGGSSLPQSGGSREKPPANTRDHPWGTAAPTRQDCPTWLEEDPLLLLERLLSDGFEHEAKDQILGPALLRKPEAMVDQIP